MNQDVNDFIDFDEDLYIIVEKDRNVPIVCKFVYRKIFAYILKFVFWSLLQVLFKFNPMMLNVSKLLKK